MDLHIHTKNSDGDYTLEEILSRIRTNGVSTFSITDHDNISSIKQIKKYDISDLNYITGVEISSHLNGLKIHVLGYNFKITEELQRLLLRISILRRVRILEMLDFLKNNHNIEFKDSDVIKLLGNQETLNETHVFSLLVAYGYGNNFKTVNKQYLKGYRNDEYQVPVYNSANSIIKANGIPVLAHPKEVEDDYKLDIEELIVPLINNGIQGIEIYNKRHSSEDTKRYLALANKYHLLISGGSDFHRKLKDEDMEIGELNKARAKVRSLGITKEISRRNAL